MYQNHPKKNTCTLTHTHAHPIPEDREKENRKKRTKRTKNARSTRANRTNRRSFTHTHTRLRTLLHSLKRSPNLVRFLSFTRTLVVCARERTIQSKSTLCYIQIHACTHANTYTHTHTRSLICSYISIVVCIHTQNASKSKANFSKCEQ